MKEGDIVLADLLQADGSYKIRPILLLMQLPGYSDLLVCGISTQLHQKIDGFDELLDDRDVFFSQTGLRKASIIRLAFLAVMPSAKIPGKIGMIKEDIHKDLLRRLAEYLTQ